MSDDPAGPVRPAESRLVPATKIVGRCVAVGLSADPEGGIRWERFGRAI